MESTCCKVCGDKARIVNYGALSCSSCKTFFRRNGFRPEVMRLCEFDGRCEIKISSRRECSACRLAKCFTVGMNSDRIRREEIHAKKSFPSTKFKKSVPVTRLPTLDLLQNDRSLLTSSEWTLFSNITHAYDRFSLLPTLNRILQNVSTSSGENSLNRSDILEVVGCSYTSMRSFVNSTPDFQILSLNEQQSLFERNLLCISTLSSNVLFRDANFLENSTCHNSFIQLYGQEAVKQIKYIIKQLDFDSTLLKLLLLIIAFSSNCMIVDVQKNLRNDSLIFGTFRLYGSQNVYVELLWKYMLYRHGYHQTVIRFARLVNCILIKIKQAASIYMNNNVLHDYIDDLAQKTKQTLVISQNEPIPLWGKTFSCN